MTFAQILELLQDGKPRKFTNPRLAGFFYKAKYPSRARDTDLDGALSAITYYNGDGKLTSPVLLLDDFECNDWTATECDRHPLLPAVMSQEHDKSDKS